MSNSEGDEVRPGLFLGDAAVARATTPGSFDRVVSVAQGLEVETTTDSYGLYVDERVLDQATEFRSAVETVRGAVAAGDRTLVHCYEGRERAPTVVTTALAADAGRSFDDVLGEVREVRPVVEPTPPLRSAAREYLEPE
jgi:hypothetical protein